MTVGSVGALWDIILPLVNPRVFTRKRAYSPGEDCRDIYGYDAESFELITLDGVMELGEEKWLFFHVVSNLSTGPAT